MKEYTFEELAYVRTKLDEKIKAATKAHNKAIEADEELLEEVELRIIRQMDQAGVKQVNTEKYGSMQRRINETARGKDWRQFEKWVIENSRLDFFQRRLNSAEVIAFIKENGGEIPPGVEVFRQPVLRFVKPRAGKADESEESTAVQAAE